MEQLNNIDKGLFWKALANPAEALAEDAVGIQALADSFPQSGLLQGLIAANGNKQRINRAVAYINPSILYKLVNTPDDLPVVLQSQVIGTDGAMGQLLVEEAASVETSELIAEEYFDLQQEEVSAPIQTEPVIEHRFDDPEFPGQDIEDEIYDEIVGIEDIYVEQVTASSAPAAIESGDIEEDTSVDEPVRELLEKDHFVIDGAFTQQHANVVEFEAPVVQVTADKAESSNLSRYDDDTMPYSFMWWLAKTRKEHAKTYQPYVFNAGPAKAQPQVPEKPAVDELQQQYVESIFNLNAIEELERSTAVSKNDIKFDATKKEDRIIKRFIHAEPQIKHPTSITDTENKARKSSEDADTFVTETLARIYTEQMLYQKAIDTYKKLMLKFPEKSLYFAGQIEQIEKKSN